MNDSSAPRALTRLDRAAAGSAAATADRGGRLRQGGNLLLRLVLAALRPNDLRFDAGHLREAVVHLGGDDGEAGDEFPGQAEAPLGVGKENFALPGLGIDRLQGRLGRAQLGIGLGGKSAEALDFRRGFADLRLGFEDRGVEFAVVDLGNHLAFRDRLRLGHVQFGEPARELGGQHGLPVRDDIAGGRQFGTAVEHLARRGGDPHRGRNADVDHPHLAHELRREGNGDNDCRAGEPDPRRQRDFRRERSILAPPSRRKTSSPLRRCTPSRRRTSPTLDSPLPGSAAAPHPTADRDRPGSGKPSSNDNRRRLLAVQMVLSPPDPRGDERLAPHGPGTAGSRAQLFILPGWPAAFQVRFKGASLTIQRNEWRNAQTGLFQFLRVDQRRVVRLLQPAFQHGQRRRGGAARSGGRNRSLTAPRSAGKIWQVVPGDCSARLPTPPGGRHDAASSNSRRRAPLLHESNWRGGCRDDAPPGGSRAGRRA